MSDAQKTPLADWRPIDWGAINGSNPVGGAGMCRPGLHSCDGNCRLAYSRKESRLVGRMTLFIDKSVGRWDKTA